jgi:deoxycytidylate deaminase
MTGPCAKQTVTATVMAQDGRRFVATNHCNRPQPACPRDGLPTGTGYYLCRQICDQPAHAEVNVLAAAGEAARGATLYLQGHTYACQECLDACMRAGIARIGIGSPP